MMICSQAGNPLLEIVSGVSSTYETGRMMKIWMKVLSSVAQSCPTLCNPMDCSTPGFPVHHQLLEPAQTNVHQADAIQPVSYREGMDSWSI